MLSDVAPSPQRAIHKPCVVIRHGQINHVRRIARSPLWHRIHGGLVHDHFVLDLMLRRHSLDHMYFTKPYVICCNWAWTNGSMSGGLPDRHCGAGSIGASIAFWIWPARAASILHTVIDLPAHGWLASFFPYPFP